MDLCYFLSSVTVRKRDTVNDLRKMAEADNYEHCPLVFKEPAMVLEPTGLTTYTKNP